VEENSSSGNNHKEKFKKNFEVINQENKVDNSKQTKKNRKHKKNFPLFFFFKNNI